MGISLSADCQEKQGRRQDAYGKIPNSRVFFVTSSPMNSALNYLVDVIPTVTGRFSLALEASSGACFILAAHLPP